MSRTGICEIFRLVDVDISEAYLDYMMCKIYEPSIKEVTSYLEVFDLFEATEYKNPQSNNNEKPANTASPKKPSQGEGYTASPKKPSQGEGYYSDHFEEEEEEK